MAKFTLYFFFLVNVETNLTVTWLYCLGQKL